MDVHVTREVIADDAGDWLLVWQREGWTPVTAPAQVGVTLDERTVLRFTLATTAADQRSARTAPREADLPAWVPVPLGVPGMPPAPCGSHDRWPYDSDVADRGF